MEWWSLEMMLLLSGLLPNPNLETAVLSITLDTAGTVWMIPCGLGTGRGCGWQKTGAFINLGSYYLVGIPSAILLAFVFHNGDKGSVGILGIVCALSMQSLKAKC
ncbi:hypothetical protein AAG906_014186 [Vitis piasezkii]